MLPPLRPFQKEAIERLKTPGHLVCVAPTGSGKTRIIIEVLKKYSKRAIIVTPLIALARQQVKLFESTFTSKGGKYKTEVNFNTFPNLNLKGSKIWIVSPERLQYSNHLFQKFEPDFFVVDEAHTVFEWGESFRPAFQSLAEYSHHLSVKRSLWLTATITGSDGRALLESLPNQNRHQMGQTRLPENLEWIVKRLPISDRFSFLCKLIQENPTQIGIVFVNTRNYAMRVANLLRAVGIKASAYHAGFSDEERKIIENQIKNNELSVVVATSAFGMGMDLSIGWVCLFQTPMNILQAVQMAGRSSRSVEKGHAYLLWDSTDFESLEWLLSKGKRAHDQLIDLFQYVSGHTPNKEGLEKYFKIN